MNTLAYLICNSLYKFMHVLLFYHLSEWGMGNWDPEATFCGFQPKWVLQCFKIFNYTPSV